MSHKPVALFRSRGWSALERVGTVPPEYTKTFTGSSGVTYWVCEPGGCALGNPSATLREGQSLQFACHDTSDFPAYNNAECAVL